MTFGWTSDNNRFNAAARIITAVMDSMYAVNNEVEFALRVYGSQFPSQEKNCTDTKLEVPFNLQNASQIKQRMKYIIPLGSSPIAYSLIQASKEELANTSAYDYNFVLITDGGETCGGDICETFSKIIQNKVKVSPYIIGLDSNVNLTTYYQCLGQYVSVTKPSEIAAAVKLIVDNNRPLLNKPKVLDLVTQYSNSAPLVTPEEQEIKLVSLGMLPSIARKTLFGFYNVNRVAKPISYRNKTVKPNDEFSAPLIDNLATLNVMRAKFGMSLKQKDRVAKLYKKMQMPGIPQELLAEPEPVVLSLRSIPVFLTKPKLKLTVPASKASLKYKLVKLSIPQELLAEPEVVALQLNKISFSAPKPKYAIAPASNKIVKPYKTSKLYFPEELRAEPAVEKLVFPGINVPSYRFGYFYSSAPPRPRLYKRRGTLEVMEHLLVKAKPKPVKPGQVLLPKAPDKTPVKLTTLPAPQTQVAFYFTDGKGRYFKTKPMCAILDPENGKPVQTFMRDVLSNGDPEPVATKAFGKVGFVVYNNDREVVVRTEDIVLEEGKLNNIEIIVQDGTLVIQYISNTAGPRRIMEYNAVVKRKFSSTNVPDVNMKCSEVRTFEPGDYHIEIDVFPKSVHYTDIAFNATTVIEISMPGLLTFTNAQNLGPVQIMYQNADQFSYLTTINVSGDVTKQEIKLQPGLYKASFRPAGAARNSPPIIVNLAIKANRHTRVELKDYGTQMVSPDMIGEPVFIDNGTGGKIKVISSDKR
jgi:hypothetical protein